VEVAEVVNLADKLFAFAGDGGRSDGEQLVGHERH